MNKTGINPAPISWYSPMASEQRLCQRVQMGPGKSVHVTSQMNNFSRELMVFIMRCQEDDPELEFDLKAQLERSIHGQACVHRYTLCAQTHIQHMCILGAFPFLIFIKPLYTSIDLLATL